MTVVALPKYRAKRGNRTGISQAAICIGYTGISLALGCIAATVRGACNKATIVHQTYPGRPGIRTSPDWLSTPDTAAGVAS